MGHPIFARVYAKRSVTQAERQMPHRRALLAGLSGRVLEVGCGNGLNFPHYPPEVTEVVAVEPEPYLRQCATVAAGAFPGISVIDGTAEQLATVTSGLFDAVVFSLVLCSVTDPARVLRQATTVSREGAEVRLYEHVLSEDPTLARAQRWLAPLWSLSAGGCRPDRDLLSVIGPDVEVLSVKKFDFCSGPRIPLALVAPHVLVTARLRGGRP